MELWPPQRVLLHGHDYAAGAAIERVTFRKRSLGGVLRLNGVLFRVRFLTRTASH
jgi:hypothetical protein